ncbi:gluconokinase [Glycomyces sp. NPDC046736]|uniref:gluconokinase n=1 Tax=Glycomyces sp. NPDC046736 TaxID=3155615 RepID=UPI0033C8548B
MTVECLVVMGVSGSGKSTIAGLLSERLGWPMAEGDDFHPESNVAKMRAGEALSDQDRLPWLESLRAWIRGRADAGESTVVTCSALKHSYRDVLRAPDPSEPKIHFIHLHGSEEVIAERLAHRKGHFMPPALLRSQLAALEPLTPGEHGLLVDIREHPEQIVEEIIDELGLEK